MAFARPTLLELVERIQADFVSRLPLEGAPLRVSMVRIFARVIAGAVHMVYGALDWLLRQIFPDTSDEANLVRQAALFGLVKTAPVYARATVRFTGVTGTVVPTGTLVRRSDGAEYMTTADVTMGAFSDGFTSTQAVLAGAAGSLTVGAVLTLDSPPLNIGGSATVMATINDGVDLESTESLRARLLARMASPPMGGVAADYVAWAREVAGVTRAWVTPFELGPGTVVVRFVRDNDASPIPDAGEVALVQAHLDEVKPAHAAVTAHAPALAPVNFTLHVEPNTLAVQNAVAAELGDLVLRRGEPGGVLLLSEIRTAIGVTAGLTDYSLTGPVADVTFTANQLPSIGTFTWS